MLLVSSCSCFCPTHWCQVLSREWRCSWSSADRRCSNCIWVINNFTAYKGVSYIRSVTANPFQDIPMSHNIRDMNNYCFHLARSQGVIVQIEILCMEHDFQHRCKTWRLMPTTKIIFMLESFYSDKITHALTMISLSLSFSLSLSLLLLPLLSFVYLFICKPPYTDVHILEKNIHMKTQYTCHS